jgi:tripartite-type tricarboxylate transporter receptor subunit TctC
MAPTSTFTAHPYLHEKLPYDVKELVPIARVSNTVVAVGVPASLGVNSLDDLISRAKAEPGKLNMASATGANDFVATGFLKQSGAEVARVPYRDTVQAINDLAEGRIQLYVAAYAIMRPQVQAGKVKIIAITNSERAPVIKDVPTAKEAGHPALGIDWAGRAVRSEGDAAGVARPHRRGRDRGGERAGDRRQDRADRTNRAAERRD